MVEKMSLAECVRQIIVLDRAFKVEGLRILYTIEDSYRYIPSYHGRVLASLDAQLLYEELVDFRTLETITCQFNRKLVDMKRARRIKHSTMFRSRLSFMQMRQRALNYEIPISRLRRVVECL